MEIIQNIIECLNVIIYFKSKINCVV